MPAELKEKDYQTGMAQIDEKNTGWYVNLTDQQVTLV